MKHPLQSVLGFVEEQAENARDETVFQVLRSEFFSVDDHLHQSQCVARALGLCPSQIVLLNVLVNRRDNLGNRLEHPLRVVQVKTQVLDRPFLVLLHHVLDGLHFVVYFGDGFDFFV